MAKRLVVDGVTVERHGAQIVFRQASMWKWVGSLLAVDKAHDSQDASNYPVIMRCVIKDEEGDGYHLTTMGARDGGTRHRYFNTLDEAQEAAIKWAARRFYIEEVVAL